MPKIQAELKLKNVLSSVKFREDWWEKIEAYCHYLNPETPSSPGYVLTECFKQIAEKDAEFLAFLKTYTPKAEAKSDPQKGKAKAAKSDA